MQFVQNEDTLCRYLENPPEGKEAIESGNFQLTVKAGNVQLPWMTQTKLLCLSVLEAQGGPLHFFDEDKPSLRVYILVDPRAENLVTGWLKEMYGLREHGSPYELVAWFRLEAARWCMKNGIEPNVWVKSHEI